MLSRRLRLVKIDADFILRTLLNPFGGWTPHIQIQGLPKDTTLVAMQTKFDIVEQLVLLVHSDEFDEVPEGEEIPTILPTIHTRTCLDLAVKQAGASRATLE